MADNSPILNLNTINPVVRIDGDDYTLRTREDLTIVGNIRTSKQFQRFQTLRFKGKRTPNEERELKKVLGQLCAEMLEAPPEVHAKLTQMQQLAVVTVFFQQVALANGEQASATSTSKKRQRG